MVITVTLSPCIDKTLTLESFSSENLNRAESSRLDPGGKGVNVSLALARLGEKSLATGFSFDGGDLIHSALKAAGVEDLFVKCRGNIRTNTKIFVKSTGKTIEINEQNPTVDPEKIDELLENIRKLTAENPENTVFVLSGSLPPGVPKDIYRRLIEAIRAQNPLAKVILDCEGEPLLEGLRARPTLIKPNVEELERTFGVRISGDGDVKNAAREVVTRYGLEAALVSNGAKGAAIVTEAEFYALPALKIAPKSAQGAGDAMVAGACLALENGLPPSEILVYGICAAAGAVELEGTAFCDKERFADLLKIARKNL